MSAAPMAGFPVPVVCPHCHGALRDGTDCLTCQACARTYSVVHGIPDLRVEPDAWITFDADREKAARLENAARELDFAGTVRHYWELTPETPRRQAERFIQHALDAEARSRAWLSEFGPATTSADGPWLDVGCGTADLGAVAPGPIVSCDVALRWLVVARKRLQQGGRPPLLICCNAEHLPFPDGVFRRVLALGLIEHVDDSAQVFGEMRRVLGAGGALRARAVNRYSVLAEPHVQVWGVGYVPRRWADRYVRWRTGHGYGHHRPLSARELRTQITQAGFLAVGVEPARALGTDRRRLGKGVGWLAGFYNLVRRVPGARRLLGWVTPALDLRGTAP